MGLGAETRKSVVDKHFGSRDEGRYYDKHPSRSAQNTIREVCFQNFGYTFNQAGRMQDCLEERMQNANKFRWRDAKIYRNKDVPWRVKCWRKVEHFYSVFCFGSENVSCSQAILDTIDGWETEAVRPSFRFKKR